jgi:hypothetical protein
MEELEFVLDEVKYFFIRIKQGWKNTHESFRIWSYIMTHEEHELSDNPDFIETCFTPGYTVYHEFDQSMNSVSIDNQDWFS